jgi:hypothetical protein
VSRAGRLEALEDPVEARRRRRHRDLRGGGASGGRRTILARRTVPGSQSAGWLERWADALASDLEVKLHRFDLRGVRSEAEWFARVRELGWPGV